MSKSGLFYVPILLLFATASFAQTMVPNFSVTKTSGCAPLSVQFLDQTTGNPTAWTWDFGNGTLANVQNPVVTFSTPGTYTIRLVVRNADGTTGTIKTDYITVSPSPQAAFSSNLVTGCAPVDIAFYDATNTNGSTVTYNWDFGDNTSSTAQNPVKSYTQTGFYNVTLTVISNNGCKSVSSRPRYLRIVPGIKAQFEPSKTVTCRPPFPIDFDNQTAGPGNMTYQWDLGNGTTSTAAKPSTGYNATGTFNVTLTATSDFGCTGTITKPVTLTGPSMSINAPDTVCQNSKVFFRNISSITPKKVQWVFGNGESKTGVDDSTVYPVVGDYTIKLINTYENCVDSAFKTIHVRSSPDIDFAVLNAESCKVPLTVTAQDASPSYTTIVDWRWDFGDGGTGSGSPATHTYRTAGNYNVSVIFTDNKGCEGRISKPAVVKIQKPVVAIKNVPDGGCRPFTWNPDDSVASLDGVVSWNWDFGDGGTSTLQAPSHTYTNTGTYDVTLTITTRDGCTETVRYDDAIRVGTPPTVNFTMSDNDICASEIVQFTDQSTPAATINKWEWEFGTDGTSTERNPKYTFSDTGTFQIQLTAYNNGCAAKSALQQIIVRPPIAKFDHSVVCGSGLVNFTNTSIVDPALGAPVYSWNFGDGSGPSNLTSPSHTYATVGTFTVTLTVTNGTCTDVFEEKVLVAREIPAFTMSANPACVNTPVNFASSNPPANVKTYSWSFDGGTTFHNSDQDTSWSFSSYTNYNIILQIEDKNGCIERSNQTLTVTGPNVRFISNTPGGCTNSLVTFTDQSSPAGSIRKWTFDYGDGQSQTYNTLVPFTHQYRDTGSYVVRMTVTDNLGCSATYTATDTVFVGAPTAAFSTERDTICPTSAVQFIDESKGKGLTYEWKFGDGNTSALQDPMHTYGGAETHYNVQLIVHDRGGCTDTATRNRYITTIKPKPAFDVKDTTTICPPIETKFTFQGAHYDSLYWDFGDGFTSSLTNPTHFYNSYGDFTAKLYVVGYGGCLDSASTPVSLYNPATSTTWNYGPLEACNELVVNFDITTPPSTTFLFLYGDGGSDNSQALKFSHLYSSPAFYAPALILTDVTDCQVAVGGNDMIRVIGAEPFFGSDKKKFCDSGTVAFTNFTIGNDPVVTRTWDFGDGTTSNEYEPAHYFQQPGTYLVGQTVTTQTGCVKTIKDTVRVFGTPHPLILGDSVACINEPARYQGTLTVPDTAITWLWKIGSVNMNTQDVLLNFPESGNYVLRLEASNLLGCTDSTKRNLYVPPTPQINIQTNPVTIPVTTGITLPVTYGENINSYLWTPDKNLSCLDCPTPYANPKLTTTYKIKVEDIYGCTNQKELTVNVICSGLNYFLPNTFSPNGDGVNDVFAPRGNGLTRINSMRIFNRWGEQVFEKMNFLANDRTPSGGWDGTFKGKPASSDVYIYIIEFVCENASVVPVRGNVALIR